MVLFVKLTWLFWMPRIVGLTSGLSLTTNSNIMESLLPSKVGRFLVSIIFFTVLFGSSLLAQTPKVINISTISELTSGVFSFSNGDIIRMKRESFVGDDRPRYYVVEADETTVPAPNQDIVIRIDTAFIARFKNNLSFQCGEDRVINLNCPSYQALVSGGDFHLAIQQAIDDVGDLGGGVVILTGGRTYHVSDKIVLRNNTTLKSSNGFAMIRPSVTYTGGNRLVDISEKENVKIEGIEFNGLGKVGGIYCSGSASSDVRNVQITNCEFRDNRNDPGNPENYAVFIRFAEDIMVENCFFSKGNLGVWVSGRNSQVRILENEFENTLTDNPIRVSSSGSNRSNNVWIENNKIDMGRGQSIIDMLPNLLPRDPETGYVNIGAVSNDVDDPYYNQEYRDWRLNGFGPSAINITTGNNGVHEDIYVLNNTVDGPDYGFFDGGSADLFALKDINRLRCSNNSSRNSGDLGFAIERCVGGIISNNHASRNNSGGIALSYSRNCVVTGNECNNNGLRRNLIYQNIYGGIMVVGSSFRNVIEGNHLYSYNSIDVSIPDTNGYTFREVPTQHYGIVIRAAKDVGAGELDENIPFRNKIGVNSYGNNRWGPIYTQSASTEIAENFSQSLFPNDVDDRDYPVGTWVKNKELDGFILGWGVASRIETRLSALTSVGGTQITVEDGTGIEEQQIIGIELNRNGFPELGTGNVHWTTVSAVNGNLITLTDAIADPDVNDGITEAEASPFGRVVVLSWQVVGF